MAPCLRTATPQRSLLGAGAKRGVQRQEALSQAKPSSPGLLQQEHLAAVTGLRVWGALQTLTLPPLQQTPQCGCAVSCGLQQRHASNPFY